jgi:hypothetical protein
MARQNRNSRVRQFSNHNEKIGYGKNLKMDNDTYALRRKVMNVLYEAKTYVPNLSRIEVRITDKPTHSNHSGIAYMGANVIFIPKRTLGWSEKVIREVVLHEVLHATLSIEHDEKCPLMSATHSVAIPLTKAVAYKHFVKYFK